jgi:hypothetical protein
MSQDDSTAAMSTAGLTAPPHSGVPIQQVRFPHSPSPLPGWALGAPSPVYSEAPARTYVPMAPTASLSVGHGEPFAPGTLYGGVDGPLFHGSSMWPSHSSPPLYRDVAPEGGMVTSGPAEFPPKFHKIEFTTYDGSVDPLNWLTHCEQFFWGQRTPVSQRTWMASYHLTGVAQTWYYALEQDEGMPSWERFKDLCRLRFGPPTYGSRLAELGRLPFLSSVQEFAERFQTLLAHSRDISTCQKAELFVGGLPEHIRVDVAMRAPPDLQMAMYLARAFESRAVAMLPSPQQQRGSRPPQRQGLPPRTPAATMPPAAAQLRVRPLHSVRSAASRRQRCRSVVAKDYVTTVTSSMCVGMCAPACSTSRPTTS